MPSPSVPPPEVPLLRRILPLLLGLALVFWVVSRLEFGAFLAAVRRTDYVVFGAFALAFNGALLAADCLATTHVYRRTVAPIRYRELFVIRAASYLPSIVNHHLGQAWLTYFLARAYGAPLIRTAGATLLVYATTFGALFLFLLIGLPFNHGRLPWLGPAGAVIGLGGVLYLVVITLKPSLLAQRALLAPLFEVGVTGHLVALAYRVPHMLVQFAGAWVPFLLFGVQIPLADALALMPVLMFVVALPVSPQGLGTRDALALGLLAGYAPGSATEQAATLAATTLSWLVALTLVQLAFSPPFMRRALALLSKGAPSP